MLNLCITGTDTGIGKTQVTTALLAALSTRGRRVAGMKPVETGIVARHAGTDAARLHAAAGAVDALDDVCPLTYEEPLAPLVAAERSGRPVDLATLDAARARLLAGAPDGIVVEGAGGLLVPFTRALDFAGLAARWGADVVVVAGDRLGVLNHALLTVREAERQGLRVRAVVLNALHAAPSDVAERTNLDVLASLRPDLPVLPFPFVPEARRDDRAHLATCGAPLAALLLHEASGGAASTLGVGRHPAPAVRSITD